MLKLLERKTYAILTNFFLPRTGMISSDYLQKDIPISWIPSVPVSSSYPDLKMSFYFNESDEKIDIEFFDESKEVVNITIQNNLGEFVYDLKMFTAPTLHILVNTANWDMEYYVIRIHYAGNYSALSIFYRKKWLEVLQHFPLAQHEFQTLFFPAYGY